MIDPDSFKVIHDQHGHKFGDRFLVHIARRVRGFGSGCNARLE